MNDQGIGASVRRKEDFRFLIGAGNYTDDINRGGRRLDCFRGAEGSSGGPIAVRT
jgi:carbon-monoxide dehydrogenase large subunit